MKNVYVYVIKYYEICACVCIYGKYTNGKIHRPYIIYV